MSETAKTERLTDRLRGIYTIPVNDGAGLLDGKHTFTRTFPTVPIQVEAAERIEADAILIADLAAALRVAKMWSTALITREALDQIDAALASVSGAAP